MYVEEIEIYNKYYYSKVATLHLNITQYSEENEFVYASVSLKS